MSDAWPKGASVYLTSLWGWTPETWGCVGFTNPRREDDSINTRGETYRKNLFEKKKMTPKSVWVCYCTEGDEVRADLQGKVVGFYHIGGKDKFGHRDDFSDPIHYDRASDKWESAIGALRAFSYIPEKRLSIDDLYENMRPYEKQILGVWGREITNDKEVINKLHNTPYIEEDVYQPRQKKDGRSVTGDVTTGITNPPNNTGMVRGGPLGLGGYNVPARFKGLLRELYILRLAGDTDTWLGESANGQAIYKVGLSVSPATRLQDFQKTLPNGSFKWEMHKTTSTGGNGSYSDKAALEGEYAMKIYLAENATHLGGEFYLASDSVINEAWQKGKDAASAYEDIP
ncbi:MAG: hypothetical protein MJE68_13705 [Proteobacteria bacterium]|nr:hypothetical protein [Pseudomonadota bacterium]